MDRNLSNLFIVWPSALEHAEDVAAYLDRRYGLERRIRVTWRPPIWHQAVSRFYERPAEALERKFADIGEGSFLAFITRPGSINEAFRYTSRGFRKVRGDVFDAKMNLRNMIGGEARIHCTVSPEEYQRDMTFLFGLDFEQKLEELCEADNGRTEYRWNAPPVGSNGWDGVLEMFSVMDKAVDYVILRDGHLIGEGSLPTKDKDLDLLVSDKSAAIAILNARPAGPAFPARHFVTVAGRDLKVDVYEVTDGYYDPVWAKDILRFRVKQAGLFHPDPINEFYALLYHCLFHKHFLKLSHISRLVDLSKRMHGPFTAETILDRRVSADALKRFLARKNYGFSKPKDESVRPNDKWHVPAKKRDEEILNSIIGTVRKTPHIHAKRNKYFERRIWKSKWFDGRDVAIKHVHAEDQTVAKHLQNEGAFLRKLAGHPVPEFVFEVKGPKNYILVSTWLDGDTLSGYLNLGARQDDKKRFQQGIKEIRDVLSAVGVSHGDIRADNFIVNEGNIKLIDFGWSYFAGEERSQGHPFEEDGPMFDNVIQKLDH